MWSSPHVGEASHTSLCGQAADEAEVDVEGPGWCCKGGPSEAGRKVPKVGLILFLTHEAMLVLWLFIPSAAVLTESMMSPGDQYTSVLHSDRFKYPHVKMKLRLLLTHTRLFHCNAILIERISILQTSLSEKKFEKLDN